MSPAKLHIPRQYLRFAEKTLMLCLGHREAKVFTAEGDRLLQLEDIKTDATDFEYSDNEGFGARGKGIGTSSSPRHNREHYDRVFLNHLAKQIHKVFKKGNFERLTLFVPDDMKNLVWSKIPRQLHDKTEVICGNMTKSRPIELVRKLNKKVNADREEEILLREEMAGTD